MRLVQVRSWVTRVTRHAWARHLWRAIDRYVNRLGDQFAGAVTFNSVIATVPMLMFGFSMVGMTLTVVRPDWLRVAQDIIAASLGDVTGGKRVAQLIDGFLSGWRGVGIVGLVLGLVAGMGWIGSVRSALHALCLPGFEVQIDQRNFFVQRIRDVVLFFAVLVLGGLVLSSGTIGSWLGPHLFGWFKFAHLPGQQVAVRVLAIVLSICFGYMLFVFIYRVLADVPMLKRALRQGALAAAIAVALLQLIAPWLIGILGNNRGVQLFGTVLVVMIMLSIFARIVLIAATWIATANQPAMARRWIDADAPIRDMPGALTVPGHWESIDACYPGDVAPLEADPALRHSADQNFVIDRRRDRSRSRARYEVGVNVKSHHGRTGTDALRDAKPWPSALVGVIGVALGVVATVVTSWLLRTGRYRRQG